MLEVQGEHVWNCMVNAIFIQEDEKGKKQLEETEQASEQDRTEMLDYQTRNLKSIWLIW